MKSNQHGLKYSRVQELKYILRYGGGLPKSFFTKKRTKSRQESYRLALASDKITSAERADIIKVWGNPND